MDFGYNYLIMKTHFNKNESGNFSFFKSARLFTGLMLSSFLCFISFQGFAQETESVPGIMTVCPYGEFDGHYHTPAAKWIRQKMLAKGQSLIGDDPCSTILVTYNGFSPQAQTAFQAAVDIWAAVLSTPVTINIQANWVDLGPNVGGSASPYSFFRNFPNAPTTNYYPSALADKIAGVDLNPGGFDIICNFNSSINWYYGTDGNTPFNQGDLVSVVLHELGHGLGITSGHYYENETQVGDFGYYTNGTPLIYDTYLTEGPFGTSLIDLSGTTLGSAIVGNAVYNNSPLSAAALNGAAPRMYAPLVYALGSSISHLDESTYPSGNSNSLMTPSINAGEAIHNPGDVIIGLLEDMGWSICYAADYCPLLGLSIGDPCDDGDPSNDGDIVTEDCECEATSADEYCGPILYSVDVEPITFVNVAGISNRTSEVINGSPDHEYFTEIEGNMVEGYAYTINLEGNTAGGYTCRFTVFIDWNQDGLLDNDTERYEIGAISNSTGVDDKQATAVITVPAGVALGSTRMRVIKQYGSNYAANSCTGSGYGQAEDYTINITNDGGFSAPYCEVNYVVVEPITLVEVAGINNRSSEIINDSPAHEDFTTIVGNMVKGESYDIALEGNTAGNYSCSFTVFIDWNQDGILDNDTERIEIGSISNSTGIDDKQAIGTINVPAGAADGPTRMRVLKKFNSPYSANSCAGTNWGQAEDYTINVSQFVVGCLTTSQYGSANVNTSGLVSIATCQYFQEYSIISGVNAGYEYQFSGIKNADNSLAYITVRSGTSDGTVIGAGISPLTVTASSSDNLYVHWNTDSGCGTGAGCATTTALCITCATIADCVGVVGGTALPGTSCDDGNAYTVNDLYDADCNCAGEPATEASICSTAIPVVCNAAPATYSSAASNGGNTTACSIGDRGLWFSFMGTGGDITVNSSATFDHEMSINHGACNDLTNVACKDGSVGAETFTISGSLSGVMYYVYIARYNSGSTTTGDITIAIDCASAFDCPDILANFGDACDDGNPLTLNDKVNTSCECVGQSNNDNCENAIAVAIGETGIVGDNTNASPDGPAMDCAFGNDPIQSDVWFSFVAPEDGNLIIQTIAIQGSAMIDTQVQILDGCGGNIIACNEDSIPGYDSYFSYITLACGEYTPGHTYYIQVDGWNGNVGEFKLSVTSVPCNDDCNFAIPLQCGQSISGSTFGATSSGLDTECGGFASWNALDVWYSFEADGVSNYTVTVSPEASNWDGVIFVYSGDCDDLIGEACADNISGSNTSETITLEGIAAGTYYVRTYEFFGPSSYTINLSCGALQDCPVLGANFGDACDDGNPLTLNDVIRENCTCAGTPVNDICADAITLVVNEPGDCAGNETIGTTFGASSDGIALFCEPSNPDVYYTFNSGNNNQVAVNLSAVDLSTDIMLTVFEQSCNGATIVCHVPSDAIAFSTDPFTNYVVRVSSNISFGLLGDFILCVERIYDCTALQANIGDACDDGDPGTHNDIVNENCNCVGTSGDATLNGSVTWNSACGERNATVKLYTPGTSALIATYNVFIQADGSFNIPEVEIGTFDVIIKVNGYLAKGIRNVELTAGTNSLVVGAIINGDLNNDGFVNFTDFSIFSSAFSSAIYVAIGDLNCDGFVNFTDFSILNAGFYQQDDTAPLSPMLE